MEKEEKRARNQNSVKKYQENRDAIMLRPAKEEGLKIRSAANLACQSVQAYVLQAVRERMQREQAAGGSGISDPGQAQE